MEPETTQMQPTPKPNPIIIKKNNNAPLAGAIIFLALVIGAAAFYVGGENDALQSSNTPSPTISNVQTITPVITVIEQQTITLKKLPDLAFSEFTISYPPDWVATEESSDFTRELKIKKGQNEIKIHQGPMGGNLCVFEGEVPDRPANDYTKTQYKEIISEEITLRRVETDGKSPPYTYSFCSNSPLAKDTFGIPTIFGVITYSTATNDKGILQEMDNIIQTIQSTTD